MDFNIPAEIQAYLGELDEFIEREIKPLESERDNIRFLTTGENGPAPISSGAACRVMNGRSCWRRCAGAPTTRATIAMRCQRSTAARTVPISLWHFSPTPWILFRVRSLSV